MFSFKERLDSFSNWPKEHSEQTKRLAIMGQYSTKNNAEMLETRCFYCEHVTSNWNKSEVLLMRHLKDSSNCPIFRITTKSGRKQISMKEKDIKNKNDFADTMIDKNFVLFNITEKDTWFCARCGSIDEKHNCKGRLQKVDSEMKDSDIAISDFYIQYLNGNFIKEVMIHLDSISNHNIEEFTDEQKNILLNFDKEFGKPEPFMTLESYLEQCANGIYKDIEKRMKKIEKDACESIYNESMLV